MSAQVALPEWVRGRGLAAYVTVFFGTMTAGSALWGLVAQHLGLPLAHYLAGAGALMAIPLARRWKLHSGPVADLTPSMHWPEPVLAGKLEPDTGPVLVAVEYRVSRENRAALLAGLQKVGHERRRDGAYSWNLFQDAAQPEIILETFLTDSWLEHMRQHLRVTKADRLVEDELRRLLHEPPRITHYVPASAQYPKP